MQEAVHGEGGGVVSQVSAHVYTEVTKEQGGSVDREKEDHPSI